MKSFKIPLLAKIVVAIILGWLLSLFSPEWLGRIFVTFNSIFGNLLSFIIPLLIIGLVAPGIAELGKGAGRLLAITAAIAYLSTIVAGTFSYFSCSLTYPHFIEKSNMLLELDKSIGVDIVPYFTISMPPIMDVMAALIISFLLGIGLAYVNGGTFKSVLMEFREVIVLFIKNIIIPFLPLYIFGIFLEIGIEGKFAMMMELFLKVIIIIFILHVLLLLFQFLVAGAISKKNPFKALVTMLPAYFTALGTQSSAATIPVTLEQCKKNGVDPDIADFTVPLCATIHLAGSTLKIVACAYAISYMLGTPTDFGTYFGFILMLGVTMVAAPGVPGGAIMAALGVIASMLAFDANMQAIMIALYITMDSFGTACNVTGDGAIALIVDRINKKNR
jgi:Na+/H+-dicarboxylate symporter